jgi:hypothetical protein
LFIQPYKHQSVMPPYDPSAGTVSRADQLTRHDVAWILELSLGDKWKSMTTEQREAEVDSRISGSNCYSHPILDDPSHDDVDPFQEKPSENDTLAASFSPIGKAKFARLGSLSKLARTDRDILLLESVESRRQELLADENTMTMSSRNQSQTRAIDPDENDTLQRDQ